MLDLAVEGHNVFFCGSGGTGKTFTVKKLVSYLAATKNVAVTCTTGMACNLYENATTLHAFAGIVNYRMNVDELLVYIRSRESCLARWKNTDTLIIDEVSQLSRKTFEAIQILGQKTRDNCKPFGFKLLLLGILNNFLQFRVILT